MNVADLLQYFSDHQLPTSLGGKFHPHVDPVSPVSPSHAPPRSKLPRQQSHPDQLCEIARGDKVGERPWHIGVPVLDIRGRSHSGSAADRAQLRPLQPMSPSRGQKSRSPPPTRRINHPPVFGSKPPLEGSSAAPSSESCRLEKLRNMFQRSDKVEEQPSQPHSSPRSKPLKPPHVVSVRKTTPTNPTHSSSDNHGAAVVKTCEEPSPHSQATPTPAAVKPTSPGIASRIQNFELKTENNLRGHGKVTGGGGGGDGAAQRYGRGGRPTRALVSVQIASGGDVPGEEKQRGGERDMEDKGRRRREEEMKRLRREEDRLQRERREREKMAAHSQPVNKHSSLLDDYENVDLGPLSTRLAPSKPKEATSRPTPGADQRRRAQDYNTQRDNSAGYENVAIHYSKSGTHSPELASGPRGGGAQRRAPQETKEKGGVASRVSKSPVQKRHQYENIKILTAAGPIPYLNDQSSSDESEDFSGDESPAPKEVCPPPHQSPLPPQFPLPQSIPPPPDHFFNKTGSLYCVT